MSLPEVVASVEEAVVTIRRPGTDRVGSAVSAGPGRLVTNAHVVMSSETVDVQTLFGLRGQAALVAKSDDLDLALLVYNYDQGLAIWDDLAWTDETPRRGEPVLAIGSPGGFHGTVTSGVISGVSRNVPGSSLITKSMVDLIQHDAYTAPGSSGGALVDYNGRLLGILHSRLPGMDGLAFAIPARVVSDFIEQAVSDGQIALPYLGVRVDRNPGGGPWARVMDTNRLELAGWTRIYAIGDDDIKTAEDLIAVLRRYRPGDRVVVYGRHGAEAARIEISLRDRADYVPMPAFI